MFALVVALAATIVLTPQALAQQPADTQYTVWSSVVFQRTGERTPEVIGDGSTPVILTSVGANQAFAAGSFFRERYINAQFESNRTVTNGAGDGGAPLAGLSADIYSLMETYATALDQQYNVATAYAFFQGLYPPFSLGGNSSSGSQIDPTSELSNNSYVDGPLGGYQYPQIHTTGGLDPSFIYTSANLDCPAFDEAAVLAKETPQYSVTQEDFDGIYDAIGSAVLGDVIPPQTWDYWNAYPIYDYLSYEYNHNSTIKETLDGYRDVRTNTSFLTILRWLSDEQQYAQLGNVSAWNEQTKSNTLPGGKLGSISTIAGNFLAAKILSQLQNAIEYQGQFFKLSMLFGDFYPMTSFSSLAGLPELNSNFYGTPEFGSSMVFELFSYANSSSTVMPSQDELWVRFYFRNGTDSEDEYQSYSLFNNGPDAQDMTWQQFENAMMNIMLSDVGDWCTFCGASENLFCQAYNASQSSAAVRNWLDGHGVSDSHNSISPAVGGVIGALVALAVAGLVFGLAMLIGGVRFHRNPRKHELGGFKGGKKMQSDQDLTIPKGGAMVGASVEREEPMSPAGGHERIGSWELKQAEAGRNLHLDVGKDLSTRPSMEQNGPDPFQAPFTPVEPHERV